MQQENRIFLEYESKEDKLPKVRNLILSDKDLRVLLSYRGCEVKNDDENDFEFLFNKNKIILII